ncbi:MAG: matrixin family metalloprotease [Candidatus Nitrosopumilus sp. bin_7KS]
MSLIDSYTIFELDKKIEYLLQEKSCVLEDELRMTNEVLEKIKLSCQTYYESNLQVKNQKSIKIPKKHKPVAFLSMGIVIPVLLLVIFSSNSIDATNGDVLTGGYLVQNLRGDTIDTWSYWDIPSNRPLYVSIIGSDLISEEYYLELKNAIFSEEKINIDNSLLQKGPKGTSSINYLGWSGALKSITDETIHPIPSVFEILSPDKSKTSGDIIITLTTKRSPNGVTGFTTALLEENRILKSHITIYGVDQLSKSQLSTIMRHEFGHAVGLAHSTAPEDLMYPTITTSIPLISECDVDGIISLYGGSKQSEVVCEI